MKTITFAIALLAFSSLAMAATNPNSSSNKLIAKKAATASTTASLMEAAPLLNNEVAEQAAFENMMKAMFSRLSESNNAVPTAATLELELGQLRQQNLLLNERLLELQEEVAFSKMMTAAFRQTTAIETRKRRNRR